MKKVLSLFLSFALLLGLMPLGAVTAAAQTADGSPQYSSPHNNDWYQIEDVGGTTTVWEYYDNSSQNHATDIQISKTVEPAKVDPDGDGTYEILENYFDVSLSIESPPHSRIHSGSVVIVMDVSGTMIRDFANVEQPDNETLQRLGDAKEAAYSFIDSLSAIDEADNNSRHKLGIVSFATNAYVNSTLVDVKGNKASLKNTIEGLKAYTGKTDHTDQFTNIEGGLMLARDMLEKDDATYKYIILITDGFPTTYYKSGQTSNITNETVYYGYNPYMTDHSAYEQFKEDTDSTRFYNWAVENSGDGVFYDSVNKKVCLHGTNYSDRGAKKVEDITKDIKDNGINIFSVGVAIGAQKIDTYDYKKDDDTANDNNDFSIIDRQYGDKPVIGSTNSTASYSNWLTSISGGHLLDNMRDGNDQPLAKYWSADQQGQLKTAYDAILSVLHTVQEQRFRNAEVLDPIGENLEFIGLYDCNGNLVRPVNGSAVLEGKYGNMGATTPEGENEASYTSGDFAVKVDNDYDSEGVHTVTYSNGGIKWDPVKSGWYATDKKDSANNTIYAMKLKYRVRLKNEEAGFKDSDLDDDPSTDGVDILVEQNAEYPDRDDITLEIGKASRASANGIYDTNGFTTFRFHAWDDNRDHGDDFPIPAVEGYLGELEFTKTNKDGNPVNGAIFTLTHNSDCAVCKAAGNTVTINPLEVTSGADGKVLFKNIPSGHDYTLKETGAPVGYKLNKTEYKVVVSYDKTTVYNADGTTEITDLKVENEKLDPVDVVLELNKLLDGNKPGTKTFEFELSDTETFDTVIARTESDNDGKITFDALTFGPDLQDAQGNTVADYQVTERPKTFEFYIREVVDIDSSDWYENIIYDSKIIKASVTIDVDYRENKYTTAVSYNPDQKTFSNTYRPPVKLPIKVNKTAIGTAGGEDINANININDADFTFNLYDKNGDLLEYKSVKGTGYTIFEFTFDRHGEYVFFIDETVDNNNTDIVYDNTIYRIDVSVPKPADNTSAYTISKIAINKVKSIGGEADNSVTIAPTITNNTALNGTEEFSVSFENRERKEITVPMVIKKLFDGKAYNGDDYLFKLTDKSKPGDVVYYTNEVTNGYIQFTDDDTSEKVFPAIEKVYGKDDAGKAYRYIIEEINRGNEKVVYDDSVYDISIAITAPNTENAESYKADVTILKDNAPYAQYSVYSVYSQEQGKFIYPDAENESGIVEFKNSTRKPADVFLHAYKYVNYRAPGADEVFDFVLTETTGGVEKVIAEKQNAGELVNFATLYYDKSGTYTYRITERTGNLENMIYDNAEFTVVVKVSADVDTDKPFKAVTTIYKNGKAYTSNDSPVFNNIRTINTGDTTNLVLWAIMAAVSAAVVAVILIKKRKASDR